MPENIGKIGEDIATRFLKENSFKILDRNYSKKFGELDIVALKDSEIYFIEVKTLSVNLNNIGEGSPNPEEKVDRKKLKNISKVIQVYLSEKKLKDSDWIFWVISILFDETERIAKIKVIEDTVPE